VKIPLDGEWRRKKASRKSTFSSTGALATVTGFEFPQPGAWGYRLADSDELRIIRMDSF